MESQPLMQLLLSRIVENQSLTGYSLAWAMMQLGATVTRYLLPPTAMFDPNAVLLIEMPEGPSISIMVGAYEPFILPTRESNHYPETSSRDEWIAWLQDRFPAEITRFDET